MDLEPIGVLLSTPSPRTTFRWRENHALPLLDLKDLLSERLLRRPEIALVIITLMITAGQERFRTLTSSYYRGAQGVIMVYDVTRRDTFTNLSDIWAKEIDLYSTNQDCIKMLVGNKVDKESERVVTKKEGIDFARQYGCLFIECSAKTRVNVEQCFEELVLKILDTPSLLADGSSGGKRNIFKQKPPEPDASASGCC